MVFGLKRKATAEKTPIFSPDQPPEEGIGIIFKVGGNGGMYVKSLVEDGPAARSGMIMVGDCLLSVDGKTAFGKPTDKVVRMLLGPFGSEVGLTLKRWKDTSSVVFSVAFTLRD
ncbi:PDZ domain-containing protein [Baffinella frigidus]|nr:PDZ domain-containing protein [Cryptophyta sp. CCMP2293]